MSTLFLFLFCGVAIAGGIGLLLARHPIKSAMSLLMTMVALAAVYAMLGAHLMAALQVLIYGGAIIVLIVYVLMLLDVKTEDLDRFRTRDMALAIGVTAVTLFGLGGALLGLGTEPAATPGPGYGTTAEVAGLLLGRYVLAFEVAGALLLAGIVGAIYLTTRQGKER